MLVGSLAENEKERVLESVKRGEVDVLVGTHSLIEEAVDFKNLGLVVIDEQHKFGVVQRESLLAKGKNPDALVMTATPIPRTLALTLYGDLDVSIIDASPPARGTVRSYCIDEKKRRDMYGFIIKLLKQGRQAYIVYPVIEESKVLQVKAATSMHKTLKDDVFRDFNVGLLHGRMSGAEKMRIMSRFRAGEFAVLVATTVIEVGLDVENATVMLIENAERFGLSQLHQLRGRVGRGSEESFCILLCGSVSREAQDRLESMVKTADGFEIAEYDLKLRGPGDLLGTRQHGWLDLKVGDIIKDARLLEKARQEAERVIKDDPRLSAPEHAAIKKMLTIHKGYVILEAQEND